MEPGRKGRHAARDLSRRLRRRVLRSTARGDRGAIGIVVALLLGSGVLFGMGALVVDTGQIYQNRAEVQNGADAAALGVAKSCADGACSASAAAQYATANSRSGRASVSLVCGSGSLGSCPASTGLPIDCPAAPAGGTNYVDVHISVQSAPAFAGALPGGSSQGSAVQACSQAEWGPAPIPASSFALTISLCVWNALTGGQTFGTEVAIFIKGSAKPCSGPAGQNVPGGFGWLVDVGNCTDTIDLTTDTAYSKPGNSLTSGCKAAVQADAASSTVVFLPVFDSTSGNGANAYYHFIGLAAFAINGFQNLPGVHPDVIPGGMSGQCGNSPCLFGYFTQALAPLANTIGTGTNYGASAIKLAG